MLLGNPRPVDFEVERPRLSDVLDSPGALTLVIGERGAGKTVAVASWARGVSSPGAWLAVEAADADRQTFWRRAFGLIEDATRDSRQVVHIPEMRDDVRRTLTAWVADITETTVLVIDGCERLSADTVADLLWISTLVSALRVVLVGRRMDSADSSTHTVRRVEWNDLMFTEAETISLFDSSGARAASDAAQFVCREVDGLPAAVASIARELARNGATIGVGPILRRVVGRVAEEMIFGEGIAIDVRQRELLARVALLERASVAEAQQMMETDEAAAESVLGDAAERGLVRGREVDGRRIFVFPPTSARILASPLRADPVRADLLSRAARLLAARGDVFEAVSRAIDARDFDLAVELGSTDFVKLITEHTDPLLAHLSSIPRSQLAGSPLVVMFLALLHAQRPRGRVAMLANYAWADHLARTSAGASRAANRAVLLIVRSTALRLLGRGRWAASIARAAVEQLDAASRDEAEALGVFRQLVLGQASMAALMSGDLDAARDLASRAATTDGADERAWEHAWAKLAYIEGVRGDIHASRDAIAAGRDLDRWDGAFFRAPAAIAEAMVALEDLDQHRAAGLLDELGAYVSRTEFWPVGAAVAFFIGMSDGWPGRTAERLAASLADRDAAPLTRTSRDAVEALLAIAYIAAGDLGRARATVRGLRRDSAPAFVASAALRLASDEPDGAVAIASDGIRASGPSLRATATLRVLRAAAAFRAGHPLAAARDVGVALDLMERSGLRTPWAIIPARDREGLDGIARESFGARADLLDDLARVPTILPDAPAMVPLTSREGDVLERVIDGSTNAVIARELGVSINTVRKQRASAYRKLGVSTRDEALAVALERGLLDEGLMRPE